MLHDARSIDNLLYCFTVELFLFEMGMFTALENPGKGLKVPITNVNGGRCG